MATDDDWYPITRHTQQNSEPVPKRPNLRRCLNCGRKYCTQPDAGEITIEQHLSKCILEEE